MRRMRLRNIGIAVMMGGLCIVALVLAYREMPWNRHAPVGVIAAGLIVIGAAETMPIQVDAARFRFRMAAQLPLAISIGLFPVLVMQAAILLIGQAYRFGITRTCTLYAPRIVSAIAVPTVVLIWYHALQQQLASVPFQTVWLVGSAIGLYWLLAATVRLLPGERTVVHPWRPIRGWLILLLATDAFLATVSMAEFVKGPVWLQLMVSLQLVALMLAVVVYMDTSKRRFRLAQLPVLVDGLADDAAVEALAAHLFEGLSNLFRLDAAELWIPVKTAQYTLAYRQDFEQGTPLQVMPTRGSEAKSVYQGDGLIGFAASSRDVVTVVSRKQRLLFVWGNDRDGSTSAMAIPVLDGEEVQAVIAIYHKTAPVAFRRRDCEFMRVLSSQLGQVYRALRRLEETRLQSETDELTGLFNYRHFDTALRDCVSQADEEGHPVSLLILDIDFFKQVNDTYGHLAGNQVLRELSQVFREMLREKDIIARYGGEEFTILLPGLGHEVAEVIAERIRHRIEEMVFDVEADLIQPVDGPAPLGIARHLIQLTVSIGIATYPTNADSALTLIRHADRAMYIGSKQSGRNKVTVYSPS